MNKMDLITAVAEENELSRTKASEVVDAVFGAHHADRVGVQRLGIAPGAVRMHGPSGSMHGHRFGHLRPRAVPRAQEQDRDGARLAADV